MVWCLQNTYLWLCKNTYEFCSMGTLSMRNPNIAIIFTKTTFFSWNAPPEFSYGFPCWCRWVFLLLGFCYWDFSNISSFHVSQWFLKHSRYPLRLVISRRNKIQLVMTSQTSNLLQTLLPHCSPVHCTPGYRQDLSQLLTGAWVCAHGTSPPTCAPGLAGPLLLNTLFPCRENSPITGAQVSSHLPSILF